MTDKRKLLFQDPSDAILYKCEPEYWKFLPKPLRTILAWASIIIFALSFLSIPACTVFLVPQVWTCAPYLTTFCFSMVMISMLTPMKEWVWSRKVGQLWYEVFQMSVNMSPEQLKNSVEYAKERKLIIAMHPHGIVPFHAILWAAYCDQYFTDVDTGQSLYGFGAAADVVMWIPLLRNIMGWMTAGSATYSVLRDGLLHGKSPPANAVGRIPRHLYILPGGVAEVFTSTPQKHAIIFKKRKGLIKLAIETQAAIVPCYVFGGTDFFNNLATGDGMISRISRKLKMGMTVFWGHFGLPIPYAPRVTMVLGEPIEPPVCAASNVDAVGSNDPQRVANNAGESSGKGSSEGSGPASISMDLIDKMHSDVLNAMIALFNKYKSGAGYPDAELEVL